MSVQRTDVCIVGGGPGGAFLGLLLARQGLEVVVLEKAAAYQREFRGETLSASLVQCLEEAGVLPLLRKQYLEVHAAEVYDDGRRIFRMEYGTKISRYRFPIDLPQPIVLNAILQQASRYPGFEQRMGANVTELLEEAGEVRGVVYQQGGERRELRASLVVGADGRFSLMRKLSGLEFEKRPMPRDFIWFKLPRPENWGPYIRLRLHRDRHLAILPTYPDLLRVGCNIPKGQFTAFRRQGLDQFKQAVNALEPGFAGLLDEHLQSWGDTSFLEIFTTRMPRWSRDGLVLIGDAAHTMTPLLGQGVGLAVLDAVTLAPVIGQHLHEHPGKLIPRNALLGFEAERREHTKFVLNLQESQERLLAMKSAAGVLLRDVVLRLITVAPWHKARHKRLVFFNLPETLLPPPAVEGRPSLSPPSTLAEAGA